MWWGFIVVKKEILESHTRIPQIDLMTTIRQSVKGLPASDYKMSLWLLTLSSSTKWRWVSFGSVGCGLVGSLRRALLHKDWTLKPHINNNSNKLNSTLKNYRCLHVLISYVSLTFSPALLKRRQKKSCCKHSCHFSTLQCVQYETARLLLRETVRVMLQGAISTKGVKSKNTSNHFEARLSIKLWSCFGANQFTN